MKDFDIRAFYTERFKSTHISAMSIDCAAQTHIQRKAAFGANWQGGMDVSKKVALLKTFVIY